MSQTSTLHALVVELMNDLKEADGRLTLEPEEFEAWYARLRALSPAQRPPVARDLVVLAARFQREARESTEWAVHALMFFAIQMSASIEQAERLLSSHGLELPPEAMRLSQAAEALKAAPPPTSGRSRAVDPILQQQHMARRR